MSAKRHCDRWRRRCCHWNNSFRLSRLRYPQLFFAVVLFSTVTMLYFSVVWTQYSPKRVVLTSSHHINNTGVNAPSQTTAAASSSLISSGLSSLSRSNTSSFRSNSSATASSNTSSPQTLGVDKYVSCDYHIADGRGLGNQMFDLAAVVYVAQLTGRQPSLLIYTRKLMLDEVFELGVKRFINLCPCYVFGERRSLMYDRRLEELANGSRAKETRGKSILLYGFFQSWKYTLNVEHRLRQHFTFLPEIRQFVDKFLNESKPPGWAAGFVRVGIHVRRGDVLNADKMKYGYTTPDDKYFAHAMLYFVDQFDYIQFIVASNDIGWCRQHFAEFATALRHRVNVTYLSSHSRGQDLAVLASCEHTIMSTGTFGWWAAWLARGITIYYNDWPRKGSSLDKIFRREDFFPPNWIGMS